MSTSAIGSTGTSTASGEISSVVRHHAQRRTGQGGVAGAMLRGQTVDGISLSDPAQVMQQLQQLGQQDPTQLKQTLSDIAAKMRSVAQGSTGSGSGTTASGAPSGASFGATILNRLADKFDAAATTGDISSLLPPEFSPSASTGSASAHAEATYRAADSAGEKTPVTLQQLFKTGDAGGSSDTSVQQQIAALRQQIAALTASLAKQGAQTEIASAAAGVTAS